ncbi:MAG: hypothetical protein IT285_02260 [Bdellovibrionales bacterium]|nr:hypothetical protein [Bdellovibrionales bacterium]
MTRALGTLALLLAAAFLSVPAARAEAGRTPASRAEPRGLAHERLRLRNTFKSPEDVVRYFCARDASGFVFTGMLDSERRAFTLWKGVPETDAFFVATKYQVGKARYPTKSPDEAEITVTYELAGVSDLHGTRSPSPQGERKVKFGLKRVNGSWRIESPEAHQISPTLLQGRFPIRP